MRSDQTVMQLIKKKPELVILPIGSSEQHGPYIPIDTDLRIAQLLAENLANSFAEDCLLLGAIPFSCSWEHKGPGMISLSVGTMAAVIHDIAHSLKTWADPSLLVLINWHGGNSMLASLAAEITARENIRTIVINAMHEASNIWSIYHPESAKDVHAGAIETSIIQAYWPELSKQIAQNEDFQPDISPVSTQSMLQAFNTFEITNNGIWGAPHQAKAEEGRAIFDSISKSIVEQIIRLLELSRKYNG